LLISPPDFSVDAFRISGALFAAETSFRAATAGGARIFAT
jgi:hypothetical protein